MASVCQARTLCLELRVLSPASAARVRRQSWDWEQHIANIHLLRWFMDDVEVGCCWALGSQACAARLMLRLTSHVALCSKDCKADIAVLLLLLLCCCRRCFLAATFSTSQ
jgi:hypothetical protein